MNKNIFLSFAITLISFTGNTQDLVNPGLLIISTDKKPELLFSELQTAKEDTNKVKLLISLCGFHWYNTGYADSLSFYAEKARKLSETLHFNAGYNEACFILCKTYLYKSQISKAVNLLPEVPAEHQIRFLIVIGERYLFLPGLAKPDLDSAFYFFNEAERISRSIRNQKWTHHSLIALGKYYFSDGQFQKGKDSFLEIIDDLQKSGDRSAEAHIWSELGIYMPDTDSTLKDELWAHGNALRIYNELKDTANESSVLQDVGGVNQYHANFDTAYAQFSRALQLRKASGMKKLYKIYLVLSWIEYARGNLDEALALALEAERNANLLKSYEYSGVINMMLGQIYGDDGQTEKSLKYLMETEVSEYWAYFVYSKVVEQYLKLNQPQKALLYIRNAEKNTPAVWASDKETLAAAKGDIYVALKDPVQAEKYYLQMIDLDAEAQKNRSRMIKPLSFPLSGSDAYFKIASFYEGQNKFSTARPYVDKALEINSFAGYHYNSSQLMQKLWWLKFKIDSASGNYLAAIQHYEKYSALKDSIFSAKKSSQLQSLQVKYETDKKETDIRTRDQQIEALKQNDLLRQSNLEQAHLIRNITIALLVILLASGGLVYKQYRQKQKSAELIAETNKVISQKNLDITQKNEALEQLVTEKEWLLKEVHHRVKNNLHTVICLLESQAAYLESDARQANEVSQQRIYAMSLIHQKIYQSEDIKSIDMSVYLPEFIKYLDDSFGNNEQIHFEVDIDPVQLDISQAVPVALIINEAVTNSIKYAFPGNRRGTIEITMHRDDDQITLIIADNGIGIDSSLINSVSDSLGLQLIRGLTKDIKAWLQFDNTDGTKISIVFHLNQFNGNGYTLNAIQQNKAYA